MTPTLNILPFPENIKGFCPSSGAFFSEEMLSKRESLLPIWVHDKHEDSFVFQGKRITLVYYRQNGLLSLLFLNEAGIVKQRNEATFDLVSGLFSTERANVYTAPELLLFLHRTGRLFTLFEEGTEKTLSILPPIGQRWFPGTGVVLFQKNFVCPVTEGAVRLSVNSNFRADLYETAESFNNRTPLTSSTLSLESRASSRAKTLLIDVDGALLLRELCNEHCIPSVYTNPKPWILKALDWNSYPYKPNVDYHVYSPYTEVPAYPATVQTRPH